MAWIAFAWLLSLKSEGQEADSDRMVSLPFSTMIQVFSPIGPLSQQRILVLCRIVTGRLKHCDLGSFQSCRWSEFEMRITNQNVHHHVGVIVV